MPGNCTKYRIKVLSLVNYCPYTNIVKLILTERNEEYENQVFADLHAPTSYHDIFHFLNSSFRN